MGFPDSSISKESTWNAGDPSSIPGSGRSAGERIGYLFQYPWASLVAQLVKNLPVMWETWVWFLGWEDPLETWKATHSGIVDSRILAKSQTQLSNFHFYFSQDMEAGQPQGIILAIPLFFPLLHILFLLVVLCAKQGLFPPPVKKENSNGCMLKANWQLQIV